MTYGMPYKGSKNKIAKWIIDSLPPAENFYDLFCGGCAVTHAAMLSGKYHNFYINDINESLLLFLKAVSGQLRNEKRWISRDDFYRLKDKDIYVAVAWSFGNNLKNYM
mgnify:FL=1